MKVAKQGAVRIVCLRVPFCLWMETLLRYEYKFNRSKTSLNEQGIYLCFISINKNNLVLNETEIFCFSWYLARRQTQKIGANLCVKMEGKTLANVILTTTVSFNVCLYVAGARWWRHFGLFLIFLFEERARALLTVKLETFLKHEAERVRWSSETFVPNHVPRECQQDARTLVIKQ